MRGKLLGGIWVKRGEEDGQDDFGKSIQMFDSDKSFIGVHR